MHNIRTIVGSEKTENFLAAAERRPSIIHQGEIFNQRKQILEINRQAGMD